MALCAHCARAAQKAPLLPERLDTLWCQGRFQVLTLEEFVPENAASTGMKVGEGLLDFTLTVAMSAAGGRTMQPTSQDSTGFVMQMLGYPADHFWLL